MTRMGAVPDAGEARGAKVGDKRMTMAEAMGAYVHDGDTVAMEGFTHLIPFAAGHEVMRQHRRDLTLVRLTPDLIYDQMIAAGCARKLIFSWAGNPGVGLLHALRRAVEKGIPAPLEIEEYSHFGLVTRLTAGAGNLPFLPLRNYQGTDLPRVNPQIRMVEDPYGGPDVAVVPALRPDVAIIHAQRADFQGNTQIWGLLGVQKEVCFAAERVVVTVEEVVDAELIRRDPNRTLIPGIVVDAVVEVPFGAHPSYAQGHYDRDQGFYLEWDEISRDPERLERYLDEWVYGLPDWAAYVDRLGPDKWARLRPEKFPSEPIDYGRYR